MIRRARRVFQIVVAADEMFPGGDGGCDLTGKVDGRYSSIAV